MEWWSAAWGGSFLPQRGKEAEVAEGKVDLPGAQTSTP